MGARGLVLLLGAALLAGGCGATADGPPALEVDRTACAHCGMLVSEPVYAAAYRAPGADPRVFDDIGCLLEAARAEAEAGIRYWFHDAASGEWIDGTDAVFVSSPHLRTPMGGGLVAYRDASAARAEAARHERGRVVLSIEELRGTGQ